MRTLGSVVGAGNWGRRVLVEAVVIAVETVVSQRPGDAGAVCRRGPGQPHRWGLALLVFVVVVEAPREGGSPGT